MLAKLPPELRPLIFEHFLKELKLHLELIVKDKFFQDRPTGRVLIVGPEFRVIFTHATSGKRGRVGLLGVNKVIRRHLVAFLGQHEVKLHISECDGPLPDDSIELVSDLVHDSWRSVVTKILLVRKGSRCLIPPTRALSDGFAALQYIQFDDFEVGLSELGEGGLMDFKTAKTLPPIARYRASSKPRLVRHLRKLIARYSESPEHENSAVQWMCEGRIGMWVAEFPAVERTGNPTTQPTDRFMLLGSTFLTTTKINGKGASIHDLTYNDVVHDLKYDKKMLYLIDRVVNGRPPDSVKHYPAFMF